MPITKDTKFRWVRPTASHLKPEVKVWQPMMYREYQGYAGNGRMNREYVNFYEVGISVDEDHVGECELGDWIEHVPLPPFGVQGLCNKQLSRADSDLCTLEKGHKGICINE